MKKIYSFGLLLCLLITSCNDDFLEKAPGVDLTEDFVFTNKANLDVFINTIYRYGVHSNFRYGNYASFPFSKTTNFGSIHPSSSISDEGDASQQPGTEGNNIWNSGNILPTNIHTAEDIRYYIRWIAIRQINLVLKRINEVPDIDENYKNRVINEIKFIRALNYMEMLKRYGGMPIVTEVYEAGAPIVNPRATFEECVNFILEDLEGAIINLPATHSASETGRATKVAAAALKSEVLLYAASPQYNTATPVLSMTNAADNKLICYGSYDANRWKLAADAAKEALDLATANNYLLVDVVANRNPNDLNNGTLGPLGNYRVSWEVPNNSEVIMMYQGGANRANGVTANYWDPLSFWNPRSFGSFWSGITVPLNFFKKYEKLDGTPQTWEATGGTDLMAKYAQLDPRFKQSMTYTTAYHFSSFNFAEIYEGGRDYPGCNGGMWLRKYIPRNGNNAYFPMDIIFRVNELYLNYAEALNEASGVPPIEAYNAVNTIRNRSAMPNLPAGLTKDQFRERVRNEIAIEMLNDDHRFWDVKRWLIAQQEGVMQGDFHGIKITRTGTAPNYKYSWLPYKFETRIFPDKMYLHPLPLNEVQKGNLIQNPGW